MDWSAVGIVLFGMAVVMTAAWVFDLAIGNAGWTDVFWSFGSGAALATGALVAAPALSSRQALVATMVAAWSLRLGVTLMRRVAHGPEDARYAAMRDQFGRRYALGLAGVTLAQAPATALLAVSVVLAAQRPAPALDIRDLGGALVFAIALLGESLADAQMKRFKADRGSRGRICETGLWAWSRHPNYFFEWLGWLAYPVIGLSLDRPLTWLVLTAPAVMYLLLTRVSGVPPLEAAMLKSKGDAYRDYQKRVSAFVPLPPRSARTPA